MTDRGRLQSLHGRFVHPCAKPAPWAVHALKAQCWFNEVRSRKPQTFVPGGAPLDPTGGGGVGRCDFCAWASLTARDHWGRVEREHAVTASNLFKVRLLGAGRRVGWLASGGRRGNAECGEGVGTREGEARAAGTRAGGRVGG